MKICVHIEEWDLQKPFRISGEEWRSSRSVVVQLEADGHRGRGEAQGVFYTGETVESMMAQIDDVADTLRKGISREELLGLLPSGGARNAIDCALWDWEAKRSGKSIWELTGIEPGPVTTVFTIGLEETPEEMGANAKAAGRYPVLKIKLSEDRPVERLEAIRAARPDAKLVVDANQSWNFDLLQEVLPHCVSLGISMVEQPLPRGDDAELEGFDSPVVLAADESCLDTSELEIASSRYDMINIKLDKTGGLTEALRLAHAAKEKGCQLMVGNMVGTSISMAPSFVIAQLCDFVDIDGPLLLKNDHLGGLEYRDAQVQVFDASFWG
ncbi:MAG: dipeptide epimerase [Gammaproteobacteria bacterium]|nr:dipeptide epimerase [Gammaproteobacteria bacterium]